MTTMCLNLQVIRYLPKCMGNVKTGWISTDLQAATVWRNVKHMIGKHSEKCVARTYPFCPAWVIVIKK